MTVRPGDTLEKDPAALLNHEFDWSEWLGTATIVSSTFAITGPDAALTKDNPAIVSGNQKTMVRLMAGTVGKRYTLTNHIVTNETPAQTDERSVFIRVRDQ